MSRFSYEVEGTTFSDPARAVLFALSRLEHVRADRELRMKAAEWIEKLAGRRRPLYLSPTLCVVEVEL